MERRLRTGTILSGAGHAGLILWVLLGDWLFAPTAPVETVTTQVSMMSSEEFNAMLAAAPAPSEAAEAAEASGEVTSSRPPAARPTPQPEPEPAAEPVPEPVVETPPPPVAEPEPQPEPEPIIDTPPPPEAVQAPEDQPLPSLSSSQRPKPKPADIVAPDPVSVPDEVEAAEAPREAVTDQPTETPEPPREEQTEAVQQETGDVLRTEATEDQDEPLGMTASRRPAPRPNRPTPAPETPKPETPPPAQAASAENDRAEKDAIAAALAEAEAEAAAEAKAKAEAAAKAKAEADAKAKAAAAAAATAGSGGQGTAASGPPLSGSEMEGISSAISRKWNVGSMSTEAMSTLIVVRTTFDQSGKPTDMKIVESSGPSQQAIDVAFRQARSAVVRAAAEGGIPLPPEKYETWKVLEFVFDANGMRLR